MLCWLLLYNNANQPQAYTYPLLSFHPTHPLPHPSRSSHRTGLSSLCYGSASIASYFTHSISALSLQLALPSPSRCVQSPFSTFCLLSRLANRFASLSLSKDGPCYGARPQWDSEPRQSNHLGDLSSPELAWKEKRPVCSSHPYGLFHQHPLGIETRLRLGNKVDPGSRRA